MIVCWVHTRERTYPVGIAPGLLEQLPQCLARYDIPREHVLLLSDERVAQLYAEPLLRALERARCRVRLLQIPAGEESKSLQSLAHLYDQALREPLDRRTLVLALGGGVVGDVAGMLAATLLRGLPFVQVPTTLLAQVDAAIGGKAGVNHVRGKNLIGVFYQPWAVFVDPELLRSLPEREWASGLAEVVKYALIDGQPLRTLLRENWRGIEERDPAILASLIERCVQIKARIVAEDEREENRRAVLNFGHTLGHALEAATRYERYRHGEAVAVGMWAACWLSARRYVDFPFAEAADLLERLPVPDWPRDVSFSELWPHLERDKKRQMSGLRFVLLRALGDPVLEFVRPEEAQEAWQWVQGKR
ncbi:MAG: 3-dehydroquinate synthase [Bacteroidetes bacterium]|nr:3-dehydroquinate synthase [Bacteroidota bacterium]MCX7907374.1 3-dehydroquinate synthase [Bacteroidota bacterium]MDW8138368.1 3-dehydroquinate synthase [Bacteroidota bacterium]MDW8284695.1 3-dehydroquinate synthase [Bacteroidota bacterium]